MPALRPEEIESGMVMGGQRETAVAHPGVELRVPCEAGT